MHVDIGGLSGTDCGVLSDGGGPIEHTIQMLVIDPR
jgi:hypothetical protein